MPVATEHDPFRIECPWCYASVGPEFNDIILVNFKLTDLGREKLEGYSCPFCSNPVGFIIKNVAYKLVGLFEVPVKALAPSETSMTAKFEEAVALESAALDTKVEEALEKQ